MSFSSVKTMNFSGFKTELQRQFNKMKGYEIFRTQVDKDTLWDTYLKSFPEGTNPVYKERTEYDCNCCKQFIRSVGNMIAIIDGKVESIWDIKVGDDFQVVTDALSALVKSSEIENTFLNVEPVAGTDRNIQLLESGETLTWEHFYLRLPDNLVTKEARIGTELSNSKSTRDVMIRSLSEITIDSVDTVLELIGQNSLYRGEENKFAIESFKKLKEEFDKLPTTEAKELFVWSKVKLTPQSVSRIRNTSIGTLLIDISEGKLLEKAVASFEDKVSGGNYKRPASASLTTPKMLKNAKEEVEKHGLTSALERRYASLQDITVNNVLFADRKAKDLMNNIFDELASKAKENTKNFDKVEEVTIEQFISKILPTAESIEIFFDNKHMNNLVSLIAPIDLTAKNLFKWSNNFSWSYTGDFADNIKERVKQQGGRVDGDLRNSLSWFNHDDLDLHMIEPSGYEIYYGNRGHQSSSGGTLDVDMNAGHGSTRNAVENIVYVDRRKMREGIYKLVVNNYCKRESIDVGFDVEIEFDGVVHTFHYAKAMKTDENVLVAEIKYDKKEGFSIQKALPSSQFAKTIWKIPTQSFHKVNVVMLSPNYWDDFTVGNKHYFFMIDGCVNDGSARGFYNEFLREELNPHRKALELVGSKMRTQETENQLSGLGFSSTQKNTLVCRVKGSFSRIIKIIF